MSFDREARAARDAALAEFGRPVVIDPDGAEISAVARMADRTESAQLGGIEIVQDSRAFLFAAEIAEAHIVRGSIIAVLDEETGLEVERRIVQGEPIYRDRRLLVEIDTAPA